VLDHDVVDEIQLKLFVGNTRTQKLHFSCTSLARLVFSDKSLLLLKYFYQRLTLDAYGVCARGCNAKIAFYGINARKIEDFTVSSPDSSYFAA